MNVEGPEGCAGWVPVRDVGEALRWRPVAREGRDGWRTYRALPGGGWTPAELLRAYAPFPRGAGSVDVHGTAVLELPAQGADVEAWADTAPELLPGAHLPPELLRAADVEAWAALWNTGAAGTPLPVEALPELPPAAVPAPEFPPVEASPVAPYVPPVVSLPAAVVPAVRPSRGGVRHPPRALPDDARTVREALTDPERTAGELGLCEGPPGHGRGAVWSRVAGGVLVRCPAHDERSPSCSLTLGDDGTLRAWCFGCGWGGDALALVAAVYRLDVRGDFGRVLEIAAALAGVSLGSAFAPARVHPPPPRRELGGPSPAPPVDLALVFEVLASVAPLDGSPDVAAYLDGRGILPGARLDGWCALPSSPASRAAVRDAIIAAVGTEGWERSGFAHPRDPSAWAYGSSHLVIIPWRDTSGRVAWYQRRALGPVEGPKYAAPRGIPAPSAPYGAEQLGREVCAGVAVVEGAVDALSLRAQLSPEAGIVVVAAPGVSGWRPAWAELLRGRDVAVAYDRDTAGDRASAAIGKLLAGVARTVRRWTPAAPAKDWNDALTLTPTERTA